MLALLISYLFASEAGQCRIDYYEPRLKPIHYGICQPKSLRGPASTRPLEPRKPKSSLDRLSKYTPEQRRALQFLKNQNAKSLDFNGDGTNDVLITKLKNGYKKVSVSFSKDGKINQISVYNPQGRLVKERIDSNMDGQVDYLYECKDEKVCEVRHFSASGSIKSMIQTIHSDTEEVVRVYEDQNGQLKLVKKSKHPKVTVSFDRNSGGSSAHTEGAFIPECDDECYDKNYAFDSLLEKLNEASDRMERANLPDNPNSDFRELAIGAGVLIHDECYENDRMQEMGIESAVEEMLAKFATCQSEIKDWQPNGAAQRSHIPEMMNVLGGEVNWVPEHYPDSDNQTYREVNNACEDIKKFQIFDRMSLHDNCQDLRSYKNEKLKLFCQLDEYGVAKKEGQGHDFSSEDTDSSALGTRHDMVFINWKGNTKVYNGPFVSVNPKKRVHRGELISTLGHEFMHTLFSENTHNHDYSLNDFATMCEAACFYDDWGKDRISEQEWITANHACNSTETPDRLTRNAASRIRENL